MRKFVSIGGRQFTIVITVAILATLAALYYFVYVPNKERDLYEHHFAWLQRTDENIRAKIDATDSLLSHMLDTISKEYPISAGREGYINDPLIGPQQSIEIIKAKDTTKAKGAAKAKAKATAKVNHTAKANDAASIDQYVTHFFIEADSSLGQFIISAKMKRGVDTIVASMSYNFNKFFEPVLEQGSFEHNVVFFKGRYIYEDFHSGLGYNYNAEDSLLKLGQGMTGATVVDQKVSGVEYKMFLQPINLFGRDRLIVAGLHSKKKFDAEKKQLPANNMMLAIVLALGILLFLPWIRIYFLGKYDRLTLGDAVESLLVAQLLMSVLFLFFFKYLFASGSPDPDSREELSKRVTSAFRNEIASAYEYLGRFDYSMCHRQLNGDITNLGKDSIKIATHVTPEKVTIGGLDRDELNSLYRQFGAANLEIGWMDSKGNIMYNWTSSDHNSAPGNYSDRTYFKDISNGKFIRPKPDDSMSFTLEPVISRTSGEFRTVICRESVQKNGGCKDSLPRFILMDWTMKSMDDVVMPAGYSFAIIDINGEVKYHSDKRKNLNENLLEEYSQKQELQEVLHGGFLEKFKTDYYEENYSVTAEPIRNYPYFIVIMSNNEFTSGVDVETFAFSWGMTLFFLIVVLIDLFIFVMSSGRRSMFKKQSLVTSWLWPRESSRVEYIFAGVGNIIMIIALIIGLPLFSFLSGIFVLFLSVPMLTIFLNTLFTHKYRIENSKWYERYKDRCSWYCLSFLILVNIVALWLLTEHYLAIFLFEIILIAIGALLFYFYQGLTDNKRAVDLKNDMKQEKGASDDGAGKKTTDSTNDSNSKNDEKKMKYNYLRWFTFMSLSRLIVSSAIPVVFFYTASYNFEQNLLARNKQYEYASQLQNKFPSPDSLITSIDILQRDSLNYSKAIYTDGKWINSIKVNDERPDNSPMLSREDTNTASLFNSFGSYFEYISGLDNDNFYLSSPRDDAYQFNNFFKRVLYNGSGNLLHVPVREKWLQIKTANLNYTFPCVSHPVGCLSWLLLLIGLVIFYFVLYDVIKRICSIDTRNVATWEVSDDYYDKLMKSELSFWLVCASPGDIKDKLPDVKQEPGQNNLIKPLIIDFDGMKLPLEATWNNSISNILKSSNPDVCLLHIESRLKDKGINLAKLECIRTLLSKKKRLLIISAAHPIYLREMMGTKMAENIAESFEHITGNLPVVIKPLVTNEKPPSDEYSYTNFLWKLHDVLSFDSEKTTRENKKELAYDELVLQEQSVSHNFYTEIWESLSRDEKFILYDLAEDGLVNIKYRFAFNLLVNKGLILSDNGHLHLFNRGFRHFILSASSKKGMKTVEMLRKKGSNWSNLKKPLLTIVIAVFIFFGISQQSMYKNFVTVLGTITAGIPVLLKLISMIDTRNERQGKNGEEKSDPEVA